MRPKVTLRFIIPKGGGGFSRSLKNAIQTEADRIEDFEINLEFREISMLPKTIVLALECARRDDVDAIGMFATDTDDVRDAIDQCVEGGQPVVTIVSDVPAAYRTAFAGIDNSAAGRTAGRLMGKFLRGRSGKVAVMVGSMNIRDHWERYFGFRNVLLGDFKDLAVLPVIETNSLDRYNQEAVRDVMEKNKDLVGLYLVTGGVTGTLSGLREATPANRPVFITHDLSPVTRRGLISGEIDAIINQNASQIAQTSFSYLLTELNPSRPLGDAAKASVGVDIYVADNLP